MLRFCLLIFTIIYSSALFAAGQGNTGKVDNVRMWPSPDSTRVVFDLSDALEHSLFVLHEPERVVIDLKNSQITDVIRSGVKAQGVVKGLRSAQKSNNELRIVLDLKQKARPKSFLLKPNAQYGHRLVVDLFPQNVSEQPKIVKSVSQSQNRDIIVAIDAGHGGEDPGAIGGRGTREKDVVLAIAKKFKALVDRQPGMRGVLIRTGDYYVSLRGRTKRARQHNADVFISIHADAFKNKRARGSSVFILSQRGASSEAARWLAQSENQADLAGGVSLDDKDDLLASVLLDLSQTASIEGSNAVAERVLKGLKGIGKTHKKHVERAGFAVLKSPDMPSILVETGFISNPYEESRLRQGQYQHQIAQALLNGVRGYFQQYPPPNTVFANDKPNQHIVSRGDTLSAIAQRYQVNMADLKRHNNLSSNMIQVGKVLRIP